MATKFGRPVPTGEKTTATRVAGPQPVTVPNVIVGEEPAKETMRKANVSVANTRSQDYPPMKTSGIVVRGGKAQTKGKMARGPMA
jgi:hypothetical protein